MAELHFTSSIKNEGVESLTPSQLDAANIGLHTVATVYGVPGSGKTEAAKELFYRSMAKTSAGQVLFLSASRESANRVRDELALGLQGATPGPLARTLTSFAFGVLRMKALADGKTLPELISGSEQDRILSQLIEVLLAEGLPEAGSDWPSSLNTAVVGLNGFRAELRDLITVCLEHGLNPNELRAMGLEHKKPEWVAAATLFERYLAIVSGPEHEGRFDASSLLRIAGDWLRETKVWPKEVSQIQQIIVDDAQELTPAAMKLLRVLAGTERGLVLFGDPDASTLGFRAADPRAMANLADAVALARRSKTETVFLGSIGGSRPEGLATILGKINRQIDTARAGRQRKSLAGSQPNSGKEFEAHIFNHETGEFAWLAKRLRELHLFEGFAWSDLAVVGRSRGSLSKFAVSLANESVPVQIIGAQSALRDEFASKALLQLADVVLNDRTIDAQMAVELLTSVFGGLDNLEIRRLRRSLRREELLADGLRNSDELLVALFENSDSLATIRGTEARKAERYLKLFSGARDIAADQSKSIEDLLWHIWHSSALEKTWQTLSRGVGEIALQANRDLDAVVALFAAANRFVERHPEGEPRVFVAQQLSLGLPEDSLALNDSSPNKVTLTTPSGLIGRRFKVVALPELIEGVWPNLRPRSSLLGATVLDALLNGRIGKIATTTKSELPDELRLLYKAVGAAGERLLISATDSEENQLSQFVGLMAGQIPERESYQGGQLTLRGMSGSLRRRLAEETSKAEQDSLALGLARLAGAGVPGAHPESWYGMLALSTSEPLVNLEDPESQVWLRPSQLENFVKCPLHWFLNAHGGSDNTFSANLGSLVHKALELGTEVNEESLWGLVESKWHTLNFESAWLEESGQRRAKRMISNMVQYLRKFETEGAQVLGREVNFEFESGRARIRGQVDRLELYPDGRVMIVDLKTGAKSFTAEEARQYAQLGLYQLAFENGAFANLPGMTSETALAGAKLVLVGLGDKPIEREQQSLATDQNAKTEFERLVQSAVDGMAMTDQVFVAQIDSHCNNSNEFGSCQIHLTKAVSYGG